MIRVIHKKIIATTLFLTVAMAAIAQCVLTQEGNSPRCGDEVKRIQVTVPDPGMRGANAIWDFSDLEQERRTTRLEFFEDSSSVLCGTESRMLRKYSFNAGDVFITGFETPVSRIAYTKPMLRMRYPLAFGETFENFYQGEGVYDNSKVVKTDGHVKIEADAIGLLVTPSGDTLSNVLRVRSERTADVSSGIKDIDREQKREITETYEWYARGYRYPVLESHVLVTYVDDLIGREWKSALYCPPEFQEMLDDPLNQGLREADSLGVSGKNGSLAAYELAVAPGKARVSYHLHRSFPVSALLSDHMGVVYRRATSSSMETDGIMEIDLEGLRRGEYILYLLFGNESYSEKIII